MSVPKTFIKCTARISPSGVGSLLALADKNAGREKGSQLKGVRKNQDRKIAPLSLPLFISIMYENSKGATISCHLCRRPCPYY